MAKKLTLWHQHKKLIISLTILVAVGIVFFTSTNPQELPLFLLVLPFIYAFAIIYFGTLLVCRIIGVKRAVFTSTVVSVFGALLLVLGSLHQLTIRDVIISLAATLLLTWYGTRVIGR